MEVDAPICEMNKNVGKYLTKNSNLIGENKTILYYKNNHLAESIHILFSEF